MKKLKIPFELKKMNELFEKAGFEAYLVGGAVRDMLLNKEASDWDVTTNATPDQVMKIFHKVIPTGIAHGTVTVHFMQKEIEVTTYRADQGYSDGRHPDKIFFAETIDDDLSRRDFTMNAIALSLSDGHLVDPFNGEQDIRNKLIRTVGKAYDRFMEDGLRPVRALRFSSQLNFKIEEETFHEISNPEVQEKIRSISMERFRDEFIKIIKSPVPSVGIKFMEETGVLRMFIPELADCRGVTQADARNYHEFDIADHCIYACDGGSQSSYLIRLAALFHDIGKLDAREVCLEADKFNPENKVEIIHFLKHEIYSEKKARTILTRLKFSNAEIERISHLVREHMFYYQNAWSDAAVRRFVVRVGKDYIDDLISLRLCDMYGKHRIKLEAGSPEFLNLLELKERINKLEQENCALSLKDLKINGNDLIKAGIKPGIKIGQILNELFQAVLDDPSMNEKERLLETALRIDSVTKIS